MKIAESLQPLARPIDSVTRLPDADNPRKRSHVDDLAASLERFGQRKPIVVGKDDVIAAGNHLHKAAVQIGATEIAVASADDMDPDELRAYVLADNRLADLGSYDPAVLSAYLDAASSSPAGLDGTGYDVDSIAEVLASLQEPSDDDWLVVFEQHDGLRDFAKRTVSFTLEPSDAATLLLALNEVGAESKAAALMVMVRAHLGNG